MFNLGVFVLFLWVGLTGHHATAKRLCEVRHGYDLSANSKIISMRDFGPSSINSCKETCLNMPDCECWMFDPSRNRHCWLAKGGCDWHKWGETNDMTSGKCELELADKPSSGVYVMSIASGLADATKNVVSKQVNGGNGVTLYSASTPHADEQAVNKWILDRTTAGGSIYRVMIYGPQHGKKYLNVPELSTSGVSWELVPAGKDTSSGSQLYSLKKGADYFQCHRSDGTCKVASSVPADGNTYIGKFVFSSVDLHMPARQFMHVSRMGHASKVLELNTDQSVRVLSGPLRSPETGGYAENQIWEFIPIDETTQPITTGYKYLRNWMFYVRIYVNPNHVHKNWAVQFMGDKATSTIMLDDLSKYHAISVWVMYFVGFENGDATRPMYYIFSNAQKKMLGGNGNGDPVFLGAMTTDADVYSWVLKSRPMPYPEDGSVFQIFVANPGISGLTGKLIGTPHSSVTPAGDSWQHLRVVDEKSGNLKNWVFRRVRTTGWGRRWVYRIYLDNCNDHERNWDCNIYADAGGWDVKVHNEQWKDNQVKNFEFEFFYLGEDIYGNPKYRFRVQHSRGGQFVRAEPSGYLWHKPIGHASDRQSMWSLVPINVEVLSQSFGKPVFGYSRPEFISSMNVKNWGTQSQTTSVSRSVEVSTTSGFEISEGYSYSVSLSITNTVGGGTGAGTFYAESSVTVETSFEFSKSKTWSKETSKTVATNVQFDLSASGRSETEALIRISRTSVRIPFTIVYRQRKTNAVVTQRGYIRRENAMRVDVVVPPEKSLSGQKFGTGKVFAVASGSKGSGASVYVDNRGPSVAIASISIILSTLLLGAVVGLCVYLAVQNRAKSNQVVRGKMELHDVSEETWLKGYTW